MGLTGPRVVERGALARNAETFSLLGGMSSHGEW
jgi:hypothetical protein